MGTEAFEEGGWRLLRRVFGNISYGWAEKREIAIVKAGRDGNGLRTTRCTRGVVLIRRGPLVEVPFEIGRTVRVGPPRPAPARLDVDKVGKTVLPGLVDIGVFERAEPGIDVHYPNAMDTAFTATTVMQQRACRYWLWEGKTYAEPEDFWSLADLYDTDETSWLWRQRMAPGPISAEALREVAESSGRASRAEFVREPGWRLPVVLRFVGQAAATLAHELLGHYVESQIEETRSVQLPGVKITYHPMLDEAITRRAVDDLGLPASLYVADSDGLASPAHFMSLRTGGAARPEPWMGNMSIECAGRASLGMCPADMAAITVTNVDSAFFRRKKKMIDMNIRCWKNGSSREFAVREPVRISFEVDRVLDSFHVEHGQAESCHGVCRKGGLLNAYTVRTPPIEICLPGAPSGNMGL